MIRIAFLTLAGLLALAAGGAAPAAGKTLSPAAISAGAALEELELVAGILRALHPGLDRYAAPGVLADRIERVRTGLGDGEISIDRWYLALSRVTAAICDEHTFVHYPVEDIASLDENGREAGFHEPLLFVDGTPYLTRWTAKDVAGLRIIDIDGVPADRLFEELVERLSVDGCARTRRVLYSGHQGLELLAARLGAREKYTIRVTTPGGVEGDLVVPARPIAPVLDLQRNPDLDNNEVLTRRRFATVINGGDIHYALNAEDSIGYVRLLTFKFEDESKLAAMMRRVIADNPRDLIVDFQGNPGGLNTTTSLFLSFLLHRAHGFTDRYHVRRLTIPHTEHFVWGEKGLEEFERDMRQFRRAGRRGHLYTLRARERAFGNPDYDGRITVLIDPATGSAAGAAATILKTYRSVRIVGTQAHSSGSHFCFRPRGFYVLPHSKLLVAVPNMCASRTGPVAERFGNAVEPDLFVQLTPAALKDLPSHTIETAIDDIKAQRVRN